MGYRRFVVSTQGDNQYMRSRIITVIAAAAIAGVLFQPLRAGAQPPPPITGPIIFGFAVPQIGDPNSVSFTDLANPDLIVNGGLFAGTQAAPGLEVHSHLVDPFSGGIHDIDSLTFSFEYD